MLIPLRAQTLSEIIQGAQNYTANNDFKVAITYQLFKGVDGNNIIEEYKGMYAKNKDSYYSKIKNTEIVYTPTFYVKVNHDQKAMVFVNNQVNKEQKNSLVDLDAILKNFENIKIIDKGSYWQCEMVAIEYSQSPFSKIIMDINKKNYAIKKQVLYLTNMIDFSDNERTKAEYNIPKLILTYSNYSDLSTYDLGLFKKNKYTTSSNGKVAPATKYKDYEIIKN